MPGDNLTKANLGYRESLTAGISGANYVSGESAGKLWLPIWSGEVIHAYDEYNQFESMVQSKTISSGTTVEVPITGTVSIIPSWDAGAELVGGQDSRAHTFTLKLDNRPMAAHFELDNVDLMLTQWEYRSELARQAALSLANTRDKQIYSYIVRAALTSQLALDPRPDMDLESSVTGALYGQTASNGLRLGSVGVQGAAAGDRATGALTMLEKIERYIVFLQESNIPYGQLFLCVSPQVFMDIRALGVARASGDFTNGGQQPYFGGVASEGGLGSEYTKSLGQLHDTLEYMGCTIIKSNHTSDTLRDQSGGTLLGEAKYNLDFKGGGTDTALIKNGIRGVMFTPECIGAIRLQGLKVDTVDDVRRNTTFTVASMMGGTGVLKPECAAIIHTYDDGRAASPVTTHNTRTKLRASGIYDVDNDGCGWAD